MADYDVIKQWHGVEVLCDSSKQAQWVNEARSPQYGRCQRWKAVAKALARKSTHLNKTEATVLREWPIQGVATKNWLLCLIYGDAFANRPVREQAAIAKLLELGYLSVYRAMTPRNDVEYVVARR